MAAEFSLKFYGDPADVAALNTWLVAAIQGGEVDIPIEDLILKTRTLFDEPPAKEELPPDRSQFQVAPATAPASVDEAPVLEHPKVEVAAPTSVQQLRLQQKVIDLLIGADFLTIEHLLALDNDNPLLRIKGIGQSTVDRIKYALALFTGIGLSPVSLGTEICTALEQHGIETTRDLFDYGVPNLLKISGFALQDLDRIDTWLESIGLEPLVDTTIMTRKTQPVGEVEGTPMG